MGVCREAKGPAVGAPALLALATILQAYTGVSDDEVIEAAVMDRRWHLVLDCLDAGQPPFSKGTLVGCAMSLAARPRPASPSTSAQGS
jgi:transposase